IVHGAHLCNRLIRQTSWARQGCDANATSASVAQCRSWQALRGQWTTREGSVNQVAFGLAGLVGAFVGALAALVFLALRHQRRAQGNEPLEAAFDQSPNGMLLVDAETLKIIAANPASQGSLGYTPVEFGALTLAQLFTEDCASSDEM